MVVRHSQGRSVDGAKFWLDIPIGITSNCASRPLIPQRRLDRRSDQGLF